MTSGPDLADVLCSVIDDAIAAISGGSGGAAVTAHDADGFVTAHVSPDGALAALELDARILRGGAERLTAGVIEAYNAARDATPATDPDERRRALQQAKERSQESMTQLGDALQDTLRTVVAQAGGEY